MIAGCFMAHSIENVETQIYTNTTMTWVNCMKYHKPLCRQYCTVPLRSHRLDHDLVVRQYSWLFDGRYISYCSHKPQSKLLGYCGHQEKISKTLALVRVKGSYVEGIGYVHTYYMKNVRSKLYLQSLFS